MLRLVIGLSAATFDPEYQNRRRMTQRRNKPRHAMYVKCWDRRVPTLKLILDTVLLQGAKPLLAVWPVQLRASLCVE
jgi:hypothetical protein